MHGDMLRGLGSRHSLPSPFVEGCRMGLMRIAQKASGPDSMHQRLLRACFRLGHVCGNHKALLIRLRMHNLLWDCIQHTLETKLLPELCYVLPNLAYLHARASSSSSRQL